MTASGERLENGQMFKNLCRFVKKANKNVRARLAMESLVDALWGTQEDILTDWKGNYVNFILKYRLCIRPHSGPL